MVQLDWICDNLGIQMWPNKCTFTAAKLERQVYIPLNNVFTHIQFAKGSFYRVTVCSSVVFFDVIQLQFHMVAHVHSKKNVILKFQSFS